ncbi:hypothetical protein SDC9_205588 [bioreactor metagenome]|uniref:Uncharacterized protein n=1 Tax=bioreactor metagenome TaxID=1076179 RepID=A0A645J455_9ZZZZ
MRPVLVVVHQIEPGALEGERYVELLVEAGEQGFEFEFFSNETELLGVHFVLEFVQKFAKMAVFFIHRFAGEAVRLAVFLIFP